MLPAFIIPSNLWVFLLVWRWNCQRVLFHEMKLFWIQNLFVSCFASLLRFLEFLQNLMSLVFFEVSDVEIKKMSVEMHGMEMILIDSIQHHSFDFGYDFAKITVLFEIFLLGIEFYEIYSFDLFRSYILIHILWSRKLLKHSLLVVLDQFPWIFVVQDRMNHFWQTLGN